MEYIHSYNHFRRYNTILYHVQYDVILHIYSIYITNSLLHLKHTYTIFYFIHMMIDSHSNTRYINFLHTVHSTPDTHIDTHMDIATHHHRRL